MGALRKNESVTSPQLRSDRFFQLHHFWFFATREGAAVGPFDSKHCAEKAVDDYIEFAEKADPEALEFFTPGTRYAG